VRLPRRLLGPRTLRLAVHRALADDRMRDRARAVAAWMAENDGARTAAHEIERWALPDPPILAAPRHRGSPPTP
jgi:UDP:flavonoid glycosyltransferase YjiC (YdhE family)